VSWLEYYTSMTAPRVYQWLTYDGNNTKKASRSHNDFFDLNEAEWTENDPEVRSAEHDRLQSTTCGTMYGTM
jgi:hypothetical protein